MYLILCKSALHHFVLQEPAWRDESIRVVLQFFTRPFQGFPISDVAGYARIFHTLVFEDLVFVREACLAGYLAVAQAIVAWTQEFVVMQCPDDFYSFPVRDLGENGRELRMNIAQVYDVGAEVVQQFGEFALDLSRAEWPEEGFQHFQSGREFYFAWKITAPWGGDVFRILHGENGRFMPVRLQEFLYVQEVSAIPAPGIIKFIG